MRLSRIIISIFVICLPIAGCSSPTDESEEGPYIYRPENNPILASYCTENAWVGTSLEGANANPPIPLPPNRSSLASLEEDQLIYTAAFCGFLPPEGYDILGSQTALKLVKELNIDRLVEQWGGSREWATNRWESTTIDIFTNNVQGASEALIFVEQALQGVIHFNFVDSEPEVGIVFQDITGKCGSVFTDKENPVGKGSHYIKKRITIEKNWSCGNRINGIMHEIFHALGHNGHTVIRNTNMTIGGTWTDRESPSGAIDTVTISVIKNLYLLPAGTEL